MEHIIEISYDSISKKTKITSNGIILDTERLNGIDISNWVYPFHDNGVKWYGLYEELKRIYLHNTYTIIFDGNNEDYELLKTALKGMPIEVKEKISKVIILYDDSEFITKITINGKIFDTQRIEKRSIDEWVKPFSFKAAVWGGIFSEIEKYIGNDFYIIYFIGNPEDMKILMENAPKNIGIFYKPQPNIKLKSQQTIERSSSISQDKSIDKTNINIEANNKTSPNQSISDMFSTGIGNKWLGLNGIKRLIQEAKNDYQEMNQNDSGLLTFGKVSVVIAVICCVLFTIYSLRLLVILSALPAIIFCFLAYTKGYKKLSICTFTICFIIALIGWLIITIRIHIAMKEINDAFNDLADSWDKQADDMNDFFDEVNKYKESYN